MTAFRIASLMALPFLAGAALAQAQPQPAPKPIPGVSPAGMATLMKMRNAPDPQAQAAVKQLTDVGAQLQLEATRPTIDVDKIAGLLKQREGLTAQLQVKQDARLIAVLRALPPGDRPAFLRALAPPQQGR